MSKRQPDRDDKLRQGLRANLQRRKQQARERKDETPEKETTDAPVPPFTDDPS